jgi:hypothetical protein
MHILTEAQYQAEAEPIFQRVFITDNPYDNEIFAPAMKARIIFFALTQQIEIPIMDAVIASATNLGDSGCYISLTEQWKNSSAHHCYIPLSEFSLPELDLPKLGMHFVSDYFIYSSSGRWGVLVSSAYYGLLGGSPEFVEGVRGAFSELDREVYNFLQYWKDDTDDRVSRGDKSAVGNWLPQLLTHVYGTEIAEKLLHETGLP